MAHEGNAQVKETKALALIQKYEAFKMEDDKFVEMMFSIIQTLVEGLKVLNKRYSIADHVKKIIKSLPKKYPNNTSLEELISSLRSHEIELDQDEPQKTFKFVDLRSKSRKTKTYQAKEDSEESEEDLDDEELSLISRRIGYI